MSPRAPSVWSFLPASVPLGHLHPPRHNHVPHFCGFVCIKLLWLHSWSLSDASRVSRPAGSFLPLTPYTFVSFLCFHCCWPIRLSNLIKCHQGLPPGEKEAIDYTFCCLCGEIGRYAVTSHWQTLTSEVTGHWLWCTSYFTVMCKELLAKFVLDAIIR